MPHAGRRPARSKMDIAAPRTAQTSEASFRELLDTVKRQKWVLLITMGVFVLLGIAAVLVVDPIYESNSRIVVEGRTQQFSQSNAPADALRGLTLNVTEDLPTQIEVMQSEKIRADALDQVLAEDSTLQPADPGGDPQVKARQIGQTNAIELAVFSKNATLAEKVANRIPAVFREYVQNQRLQGVNQSIQALEERVAEEKRSRKEAQAALDKFRIANKLSPSLTEASERSQAAQQAEISLSEAIAQKEAADRVVASLAAARRALPRTIPNPTVEKNITQIENAKQQLLQLEQRLDELRVTYFDDSPEITAQKAQIAAQQEYIRKIPEILSDQRQITNPAIPDYDSRIAVARGEAAAAAARVLQRRQFRDDAQKRSQDYNTLSAQLSTLQLDLNQAENNVQQLTAQLDGVRLLRAVNDPARVVLKATQAKKSRPNPPLYLSLAVIVGLVVSVAIVVVRDRLEDRVTTLEQAHRIAQVPTLGYVPPRTLSRGKRPSTLPSRVLENYRIVRSNVLSSSRQHPFRSLMVTSTGSGEGKSEVVANLAVAMASGGKRVLLVDAHLYRPEVHKRFNVEATPGLSQMLEEDLPLDELVRPTEFDNLYVLPAGGTKLSLADGLGSGKMTRIHDEMISRFDLVLFDTPPMLPRSDALALSTAVDAVVYVVKPGTTTKTTMRYCVDLLRHSNARLLGVIFTNTEFYLEGEA